MVPPPLPEARRPHDPQATLLRINLQMLCHAERDSDAVAMELDARLDHVTRYLERQLSHGSLRRLALERVLGAPVERRADLLREGLVPFGVEDCPLVDLLQWTANPTANCTDACLERLGAVGDDIELRAACGRGCGLGVP